MKIKGLLASAAWLLAGSICARSRRQIPEIQCYSCDYEKNTYVENRDCGYNEGTGSPEDCQDDLNKRKTDTQVIGAECLNPSASGLKPKPCAGYCLTQVEGEALYRQCLTVEDFEAYFEVYNFYFKQTCSQDHEMLQEQNRKCDAEYILERMSKHFSSHAGAMRKLTFVNTMDDSDQSDMISICNFSGCNQENGDQVPTTFSQPEPSQPTGATTVVVEEEIEDKPDPESQPTEAVPEPTDDSESSNNEIAVASPIETEAEVVPEKQPEVPSPSKPKSKSNQPTAKSSSSLLLPSVGLLWLSVGL